MRIIAGKFKGSVLYFSKNKVTRPLKDQVRESIFNLLTHSNKISFKFEKTNILDLYSGTGSFGLECLSRQANDVCFVEKEKDAIKILKKNIGKLKLEKKTTIFVGNVFDIIEKKNIFETKFELIFCDPPFKSLNMKKLIELIVNKNLLRKEGIIIFHRNKKTQDNFPNHFKIIDERTHGISKIIFGKILL